MARSGWESDFIDYFTARAVSLRRLAYALCGDWHAAEDLVRARPRTVYVYSGNTLILAGAHNAPETQDAKPARREPPLSRVSG